MSGERFTVRCGDCIELMNALPADSVDLLFTSPPYELARTYGLDSMVSGQEWVDWMVDVVKAASRVVRGLIAINCEGQTRGYRYSCSPFLLMADLHRAGFNLRKPAIYQRCGIPGNGGPDWLRNDWEPIVCVTRPGALPWSDNTAMGHKPTHAAGGRVSNRQTDGNRLGRGNPKGSSVVMPEVANPGNVIRCKVGGGLLGHPLAHENEAPFPLSLPTFFVRSFCPPGGAVLDPFCGSGTTLHAAIENGRRAIGFDIRQSQCDLTLRRLGSGITPDIFELGGEA